MNNQEQINGNESQSQFLTIPEKNELHELTTAQHELWLSERMSENQPFNIWGYGTIEGPLNIALLRQAVEAIIHDTPAMQAHFVEKEGELYQYRAISTTEHLKFYDFSASTSPFESALAWMQNDADKIVSALDPDLYHFAVLTLAPEKFIFYRRTHHMLIDGLSGGEFSRRIVLYYNALASNSPTPEFDNRGFTCLSENDKKYQSSTRLSKDSQFWKNYIASAPHTLTRKEKPVQYSAMNSSLHVLGQEALDQIDQCASQIGVHRAHIFATAVAACFYSITGETALNFSLPVTGTLERNSIGMTANVVPLILQINPEETLAGFTRQVTAEMGKVVRRQLYRGEDIRRQRDTADASWFGPAINIVSFDNGDSFWQCKTRWHYGGNISVSDLQILFFEDRQAQAMDVMFVDAPHIHSKAQLENLQQRFQFILQACWRQPDITLGDLTQIAAEKDPAIIHDNFYVFRRDPDAGGVLRWDQPAKDLERLFYAIAHPSHGCPLKLALPDRVVGIGHLTVSEEVHKAAPGTLLHIDDQGWDIATSQGIARIGGWFSASGAISSGMELARQFHLEVGHRLPVLTKAQASRLAELFAKGASYASFWDSRLKQPMLSAFPAHRRAAQTAVDWQTTAWMPTGHTALSTFLSAVAVYIARMGAQTDFQIGWLQRKTNSLLPDAVLPVQISLDMTQTFTCTQQLLKGECERVMAHLPFHPELHALITQTTQWPFAVELISDISSAPESARHVSTLFQIDKNGETFRWVYDQSVQSSQHIDTFSKHLRDFLEQARIHPELSVGTLSLLDVKERHILLEEMNRTAIDFPAVDGVHTLFEAQVRQTPDAIAVCCGDTAFSFAELNHRANRLASELLTRGVQAETRVAVCAARGPNLIVALLAVLKAGGAYVPLDPAYPGERLTYILHDCQPVLLLADSTGRSALGEQEIPVLDLEAPLTATLSAENLEIQVQPDQLVYVVYTSGSTGQPKGVMVEHHQLRNLIGWHGEATGLKAGDYTTCMAGLGFDACVWEIWPSLSLGATLLMPPPQVSGDSDALLNWWRRSEAQVSFMVTPLAEIALADGTLPPALNMLLIGGDSIRRWPQALSEGLTLLNNYGPTETTVVATSGNPETGAAVPSIGRPISNTRIYVLDEHRQPVPFGAIGELYVGGVQVARGYLNQPELTAERFLDDPFYPGGRMYRTGDLVRYLDDGSLEYLGRNDQQVKIRGFRIELGEIEAQLGAHPAVRDVVVDAPDDQSGEKRLVAWVVPTATCDWLSLTAEFSEFLAERLPGYMIPTAYIRLDALPLSPNGKLDRRALPVPELNTGGRTEYVAPQGETEQLLAKIWQEILGIERIGRQDNFFELGGHSLLVVKLMAKLRSAGLTTDLPALFAAPTLSALAQTLNTQHDVIVPENQIRPDSQQITPAMLPLAELSQPAIDAVVQKVPGGVANVQDIYALSPLQEGIFFHHLLAEKGDPYLLSATLRFENRARLDAWLNAMQQVVNRHDILRTAFVGSGAASPVQVVWRQADFQVAELDLDPADGPVSTQLESRYDPRHTRLDLTQAPLLHFVVAEDTDGSWCVLQQWHHLIGDHSTLAFMVDEVRTMMAGHQKTLSRPQPFRNAVAQARLGVSESEYKAFFRKMLADISEPVLPFGLGNVHSDGHQVNEARLAITPELNQALRYQAKRLGISLASLCHLAWGQVLARTCGQDTVVFGTVLLGRMQAGEGADSAMGLFINTLPLRMDLDSRSIEEAARQAHQNLSGLLAHEHASLALAQSCSGVTAGAPLFSALLNYRHNEGENLPLPDGVSLVSANERTNYPFVLCVDDGMDSLSLTAQVIHPIEASRVCGYMQQTLGALVNALAQTPDIPAYELSILPDDEFDLLVNRWNVTAQNDVQPACLHHRFEAQAARTPEAIALVYQQKTVTYGQLNFEANLLSHDLITRGVGPGSLVALCTERGPNTIVAILAILKAGGAYVPLDPAYSGERLNYILQDAEPVLILADEAGQAAVGEQHVPLFALGQSLEGSRQNPQVAGLTPAHLAYVIYTSGSTGKPKGVMVEHRQVDRLFHATHADFDFRADDVWCLFHSYAFDFSVWEIWGALRHGGQLVIVPQATARSATDFYQLICQTGVTVLNQTPSAFKAFIQAQDETSHQLKTIIFGGEMLNPADLALWYARNAVDAPQLVNMYGITETTVHVTYRAMSPADIENTGSPIGHRISDLRLYLLDPYGQPVPLGAVGEMYVGGEGVARGYLNRPELNAERFLDDPFHPGSRLYRSGDLARYLPNGELEYLGRNDQQVKIRGFRIECGEVEAAIQAHELVTSVAVDAWQSPDGDKRLVAWIVPHPNADQGQFSAQIRDALGDRLPDYMIPASYVLLDILPLTNNGKLDKRALPAPENAAGIRQAYEPPKGEKEQLLARLWGEVLKIDTVGRQDNFFALGGHSLLAVQLANRMEQAGWKLPLAALFAKPVLHAQAEQLESLQHAIVQSIEPVHRESKLPLSSAQQRLWFLEQLEGSSGIYHIPLLLELQGDLNTSAFEQSLDALYERHEALRSTFVATNGQPEVRILPVSPMPLTWHDLRADQDSESKAMAQASQVIGQPFDLASGPVVCAHLWQLADDRCLFLLLCHHIVSDGWSVKNILQDLSVLYGAFSQQQVNPLPPLKLQYVDYANWQQVHLNPARLEQQTQFWRETLGEAPTHLTLPTDRPHPPVQSFAGAQIPVVFSDELTASLRQFSEQHNLSVFMTVLTAWGIVLSRLAGQPEVVIGIPEANRRQLEVEPLVGFFVSTLALHLDLRDDPTVADLLTRVKTVVLAARENNDVSFEQVVEAINPPRMLDRTPLFQVMLAWQDGSVRNISVPGLQVKETNLVHDTARYELTLELAEQGNQIQGMLNYATALFDASTVERFGGYLREVLLAMVSDAAQPASQLNLMPDTERMWLLDGLNQTERHYPVDVTLQQLFEAQVSRSPEAIALVCEEERLTYAELNAAANQLAHVLIARGVGPDSRVAVCAERSVAMVVALFGVLKAGGGYVPLDPAYPGERLQYILEDADPVLLLADAAGRQALGTHSVPVLALDGAYSSDLSSQNPLSQSQAHHLAYVIYTSGSTGKPKGAMNEHRAIVNRLIWMQDTYGLTAEDTVLQKTPFGFDVSVWEFFWPLIYGARLVMARPEGHKDPDYLSCAILHDNVTTMHFVPSMLQSFLASEGATARCQHVVRVMCSGEALPASLVTEFYRQMPHAELHNLYGPTEAAIDVTAWHCTREPELVTVPIGRPVANTRIYLLDEYGQPVPQGAAGELYIGGVQVARGYLNRPELTAERFLADPFHSGGRMYRTGDLARYLPDGNIEYLGRNDQQVKIRGFRIECGEIEAVLSTHPAVREVVVDARADDRGDKRLVAWVVCETGTALVPADLRDFLTGRLPEYMVPVTWTAVDALPLSPNGKLDRRALPEPKENPQERASYEAPQGQQERLLADIWAEVLGVERIGRQDNFFELGGHSLLVVKLLAKLRRYGLVAEMKALFSAPTLASQAAALATLHDVQVPENQLTPDTKAITPELLPLASLNQQEIDRVVATVPEGLRNIQDIYGLSPLQEGILFHHRLNELGDTYLLSAMMRFESRATLDGWLNAMQQVVDRHDILRTAFVSAGLSESVQVVWRKANLKVDFLQLRSEADSEQGAEERPLASPLEARFDSARNRMDLTRAPLMRFAAAQDTDGSWCLLQQWHHLIGDHSTLALMMEEVRAILSGRGAALLPAQPFRHAVAQARFGTGDHAAFFREMLADIDEPTLPFGLSDVQGGGRTINEASLKLPAELNRNLRQQARRLGVSLASLCHLAWAQVLARMTGQDAVVFGTVLLGRMQAGEGAEQAMGLFINTLPLRLDINQRTVEAAVHEAHQRLSGLLQHEHASLAEAQRCCGIIPGMPLFSALLNYRHNDGDELELPEGVTLLHVDDRTNYPFVMSVEDGGDSLGLTAQISQPIEAGHICGYMEQTLALLVHALSETPELPVSQLDVMPPSELRLLLETLNQTPALNAASLCLTQRFEDQVVQTPEAIALVCGEQRLTYAALNTEANRLAHVLIERGVQPESRVAICAERSPALIIGLLGILKAGGAYVPLDPAYSGDRLQYILEDAEPVLLLADEKGRTALGEIELLQLPLEQAFDGDSRNPEVTGLTPASLAYVIYTSGSTGKPKGVMVEHRQVDRLFSATETEFSFCADDVWCLFHSFAFDFSVWEIWGALRHGGCLVVVPQATARSARDFYSLICRHGVTVLNQTPSAFKAFIQAQDETPHQLRTIVFGGEMLNPADLAPWYARNPADVTQLVNMYGITETTVHVTYRAMSPADVRSSGSPIGRRISDLRVYLLDPHGQPVPHGAVGELYVGGEGVARGYLNRPELNAERFLDDPFHPGCRMYRSGDLARYLPNGELDYLGRNDHQVKIRGFRIECGEVEAAILAHESVLNVAVDAWEAVDGDKRLVAWIVPGPQADCEVLAGQLRQFLAGRLPDYMMPSSYLWLDALPLTTNGKLDKRALPAPESAAGIRESYESPRGERETLLATLWESLLGIEKVGRQDNFFDLGGHSLLAVQLANRVEQAGWQLSLSALFAAPVLHALAEQIHRNEDVHQLPIVPVSRDEVLPLSFAQQRLWFLSQMEGNSETYHIPLVLELTGDLDPDAFRQSLDALYARHESLRSVFVTQDDQPQVRILPVEPMPYVWHDLRTETLSNGNRNRELAMARIRQVMAAPFDLENGPLVAAHLWQVTDHEYLFLLVCHHIVSDGWSSKILLQELSELYGAFRQQQANPLPPLALQYADYAHWQREHLSQERLDAQASFWKATLGDAPVQLTLPTDRPRPPVQSFAGAEVPLVIDAELTQALRQLSQRQGTSLFMTVLSAWGIVLSRLAGQQEVVIGMPDANRGRLEVEPLVGFFVSTLALHIDLRDDPTLSALLTRVRQSVLAARENSDLPFEQVVEVINPPRQLDRTPLFQVMLSWQEGSVRDISLPELAVAEAGLAYDIAKFDLTLELREADNQITGALNYATALFDAGTANRFSEYLKTVLQAMVTDSAIPVSRVDLLPEAERNLLLNDMNQTERVYPKHQAVHHLFEAQVGRSPQSLALVCGDEVLSYGQLDSRANRLAHALIARGVGTEKRVAVCAARKPDMVVALLAVLKAGGAYVPLDPAYPGDRLSYILSDCAPTLLLADSVGCKAIGDQTLRDIDVPVLSLDKLLSTPVSVGAPLVEVRPEHLAYVVYTSGSTGQPKGVMVEHGQLLNLIHWHEEAIGLQAREKTTCMAGLGFDACVWEIWPALSLGASLLLPPPQVAGNSEALLHWWQHSGAQVSFMVTPLAEVALANGMVPPSLRQLLIGGDSLRHWPLEVPEGLIVMNNYGPTETTVVATSATLALDAAVPSIGRPVSNTRIYLLDEAGLPVPRGTVGELYVGGLQVARGYLNQPELTAELFLADPFQPGGRMYRTGDMVRYLADGSLEYLGRNDQQVKIRGFRIELGEIETQLAAHPALRDVAVDALPGSNGEKRLVAWIVPKVFEQEEDNQEASVQTSLIEQLRQFLSARLPEYMIPAAFVCMQALPISPNGKLDRRALPVPDADAGRVYEAPQGETERLLAGLWSEVLGVEGIGRHDNFFELGGHSLLVVKLMAALRRHGLSAGVNTLFSSPTLAALASALGTQHEVQVPENLITAETTHITPALLPLANLSQQEIDQVVAGVSGGVGNVQDIYGLSPLQEGILFHHLLSEQGDTYLLSAMLQFDSRTRLDAWLSAMQLVVDRHDILRSAFLSQGLSEPVQVVWRKATLPVRELALDPQEGPVAEQLMAQFDPRHSRLDLTQAPLLNLVIAKDEQGRWLMLQQWHHMIGDHSTSALIESEVAAILDGKADSLAIAPPYRNVIAQTRLGMSQDAHEEFFREMLADIEEPVLPFELSNVRGDGKAIATAHCVVPAELNAALREQARYLGVSLASLCHLAWAQVLSRVTDKAAVVFGTVLLGRMQAGEGADQAMGLFINTLPLRLNIDDQDVVSAVRQAHQRLSGLLLHEHAPLALAQRCSGMAAGAPLFSALLNYRHNMGDELVLPEGVSLLSAEERTNYPFVMSVEDGGDSLGLTAQISQPIEAERICSYMVQALTSLSHALSETPALPVSSLEILPEAEYHLQLETWNQTVTDYPAEDCVHTVFEQQVRRRPNAIAVIDGQQRVSYAELNGMANQLAHTLIERGVQPGDRIALKLGRSLALVAAQLAVLKTGAMFVPVDSKLPETRQAWILSDSGARLIIADKPGNDALPYVFPEERSQRRENPELALQSTSAAYLMYTSGSTGQPKGVLVPHQGITRLVIHNGYADFDASERIAFSSNPAFDASTMEVWAPLLNGGQVVVIPQEVIMDAQLLARSLKELEITTLFLTTALFNQYVHLIGEPLSQLRHLISGGEKEEPSAYECLLKHQGPVKVIHAYGPTEASAYATTAHIEQVNGCERLPIGKPVGNTRVYVLNQQGQVVPRGAIGELYVGGVGVALGYLNRPELTAERFLPDPFHAGTTMYRTGDLVRYLPDGSLEYQGRNDGQVKIRGFRIEMGEIEAQLLSHPAVRDALVDLRTLGAEQRLVAWLTPSDGFNSDRAKTPESAELRKYLADRLPSYMLPSAYMWLDQLPLTPNGKVDRRALPKPEGLTAVSDDYVPPRSETEMILAHMWGELLGIAQVGRHDHFFELGGHSLLVVRQVSMAKQYGLEISVQAVFDYPVLSDLAEYLDRNPGVKGARNALPARRGGTRQPLFFMPTGFGDHSYVYEFAKSLHADYPVYAVPWPDMSAQLPESMAMMAKSCIEMIRQVQPSGPYHVFGYSSGGVLAYQVADMLQREGEQVACLGLLDTMRPQVAMASMTHLFMSWLESEYPELEMVLMDSLREMPLQQVLMTLQKMGVRTLLEDPQQELSLWERRYHFATLVEETAITPSGLPVHLLKAKEEMSPIRSQALAEYWARIQPSGYSRKDDSALGWEQYLPADSLNVTLVDGDHASMMSDSDNRRRLGECLNVLLQKIATEENSTR
ncbi:non-ribosomal peptide synthase/polyketide synthase [Photobacterium sp. R1]